MIRIELPCQRMGTDRFCACGAFFAHMAADTVMGILTLSALIFAKKRAKKQLHFLQHGCIINRFQKSVVFCMKKIFYPKIIETIKGYKGKDLASDLVAGLIVAIIALPLSIALAIASGVSPEKGIYTAIVAGFVISLLGGSRVNISGPTAAFAPLVAGIVATHGMDGLILATLMAGVILILMGLFRFGSLIKYIPCTITTGFTSGIAVTIFIGQSDNISGVIFFTFVWHKIYIFILHGCVPPCCIVHSIGPVFPYGLMLFPVVFILQYFLFYNE